MAELAIFVKKKVSRCRALNYLNQRTTTNCFPPQVALYLTRHRTIIPESPHRHSREGLSGIHLDLGLQQPEVPGQHGFPLRACGNDGGGSEPVGMTGADRSLWE